VRARPETTVWQRSSLGLRTSSAGGHRPRIAKPDHAPILHVAYPRGNRLPIQLRDRSSPTNRGKPRGVSGAVVLTFVGDNPPGPGEHWRFRNVSRTTLQMEFPSSLLPGTKVWNRRLLVQPARPARARLHARQHAPGLGHQAAGASEAGGVRKARGQDAHF